MSEARSLTDAERCSLFLLDEDKKELVAKVFDGQTNDGVSQFTFCYLDSIASKVSVYLSTTYHRLLTWSGAPSMFFKYITFIQSSKVLYSLRPCCKFLLERVLFILVLCLLRIVYRSLVLRVF